jgi:hypothetical protein
MKLMRCALLLLAAAPMLAAAATPPDLSGFWSPVSRVIDPDPELAKFVPQDAVVMRDTGPAEFGLLEFGGLKPKPEMLTKAKEWNPRAGLTVATVCLVPSIVYALQGPFPIEIYQGSDLMVMRLEYMDLARVFVMGNKPDWPADAPHTKVGYSRAHWEGDQLVVVTTHLKEATITNNGLDHSDAMVVTERYRLADGGKTLIASQLYEDPKVLENRGVRYISWRRTPGDHVHAFDCDPSFAEEYAAP